MTYDMRWMLGLTGVIMLGMPVPNVHAEKIQLKDGQQFEGQLLQKDADRVLLAVPRNTIDTIDGRSLPAPVVAGSKAPDFMATDLQGHSHTMSGNNGQSTLLQFWASWCPHCRSDLNKMKELATTKGLRLLTVSIDQKPEEVKALIEKEHVEYPVILAKDYPRIADEYEAQGVPGYFLIDAKGVIRKTWSGSLTEGFNTDFAEELTKTLNEMPPLPAAPAPSTKKRRS